MNDMDAAIAAANEFNRTHSSVHLKPVHVANPLKGAEVTKFAYEGGPLMLPAEVFAAIRGRKANHGEAIVTGRLLKAMGYPSKKLGPSTLYLLDNTQRSRAD